MHRLARVTAAALAALATGLAGTLGGCAEPGPTAQHRDCIDAFDPSTDYFPDKSTVYDATNFTLSYHRSYQVLTVAQPYPGGAPQSYVLVRCGAPAPVLTGDLAHAPQISVPVTGLFSASTTQLGMLAEIGQTDTITGVADTGAVVDPGIRARIDTGSIIRYGPGQQVNVEAVIAAHPDVLVTGGYDDASYPKLRDADIAVVADAEWLESTPLGRAEWVKVFAALTGTERRASAVYAEVRRGYHTVAQRATGAPPAQVLLGSMYQGSWSMPAGGGYAGRLIADAGGSYPWAGDTSTGSLQLNFESVYTRAGQAPTWLVDTGWQTLHDALDADHRYQTLGAVRDGQVWSTGVGYWERGVARPDEVLADLIAILHPQLVPDHQFTFYHRVSRP